MFYVLITDLIKVKKEDKAGYASLCLTNCQLISMQWLLSLLYGGHVHLLYTVHGCNSQCFCQNKVSKNWGLEHVKVAVLQLLLRCGSTKYSQHIYEFNTFIGGDFFMSVCIYVNYEPASADSVLCVLCFSRFLCMQCSNGG